MTNDSDSIRERLLLQLPQLANAAAYKAAVAETLQKNQTRIRRERLWVTLFWVFCVVTTVIYLWFGPGAAQSPRGPFLACIFFIWGSSELVKHHINSSRIDVLKEIKQVQVQILELQGSISNGASNEKS